MSTKHDDYCGELYSSESEGAALLESHVHQYGQQQRPGHWRPPAWLLLVILLVSNVITSFATVQFSKASWTVFEMVEALQGYSPLYHRDLELHIDEVHQNATQFWARGADDKLSIWRQRPSPEVNAAWRNISTVSMVLLSKDEVEKLGHDPDMVAQAPWAEGDRTYLGQLNAYHHLHCLNHLRMAIYSEDFPQDHSYPSWHVHTAHCLDILRQELQCTASLDVTVVRWVDTQDPPFPTFDMHRKCRRWEDVADWRSRNCLNDADMKATASIMKPLGAKAEKQPPAAYELEDQVRIWKKQNLSSLPEMHHQK